MKPPTSNSTRNVLHSFLVTLLFLPSIFHPLASLAGTLGFRFNICPKTFVLIFYGLPQSINFGPTLLSRMTISAPDQCFSTSFHSPHHIVSSTCNFLHLLNLCFLASSCTCCLFRAHKERCTPKTKKTSRQRTGQTNTARTAPDPDRRTSRHTHTPTQRHPTRKKHRLPSPERFAFNGCWVGAFVLCSSLGRRPDRQKGRLFSCRHHPKKSAQKCLFFWPSGLSLNISDIWRNNSCRFQQSNFSGPDRKLSSSLQKQLDPARERERDRHSVF